MSTEAVSPGAVSVVIPAYNAQRFLERAVDSVRRQTYAHWQLIIVDDGSVDATAETARRLVAQDSRIQLISQTNQGLSAARNAGLAIATGDYVQFLDADDELQSHKLASQVHYLERHAASAVVFGRGEYYDEAGPAECPFPPPRLSILGELLSRNFILVDAALTRTHVFKTVGGFKTRSSCDLPIYGCEDWDLWLRCAMAGLRIDFLDDVVVRNHWHAGNMQRDTTAMIRSHLWVLMEAEPHTQNLPARLRPIFRAQLLSRRLRYVVALLEEGRRDEAVEECRLARDPAGAASAAFRIMSTLGDRKITRELLRLLARALHRASLQLLRIVETGRNAPVHRNDRAGHEPERIGSK